jgi:hypothetical protein
METGQLPRAPALGAVVQIATELGVIAVWIDFGGYCEHDEAGRVVARATSAAVGGGTQGTGAAEVRGDADEPTAATVAIALRRKRNGMGGEFVVREPMARGFGAWGGEGEAVVLIESMRMGDKGIELKGRELVGSKR